MKNFLKSSILILLALCMLFSVVACSRTTDNDETEESSNTVSTEDTGLPFERMDYGKDLNIYYINWGLYPEFFFEEDSGTVIGKAIIEREYLVKDYLGVNVVGHLGGNDESVLPTMEPQVLSGLDDYQIYLTHCFLSLTALITQGYLADFGDIESIDLEREYWNYGLMKDLEVQGSMYLGSSDYMIHDPNAIFFNKDVLSQYATLDNPYELVEQGKWTLEKMFSMASQMDAQIEGGSSSDRVYGITGEAEWQVLSFADSCDTGCLVNDNGYMKLDMGPSNVRYANVFDQIDKASDANWFGLYGSSSKEKLTMDKCTTLFSYESLKQAYNYKADGSDVKVGILPYPKYDEEQTEYRSFDWSGFMIIPNSAKDLEMIGKSMEALAFFSEDTTIEAYYEKVLGTRIADAPEDAAMLDYIWDGIVSNPAFNFMYNPGGGVNGLFHVVYGMQKMLVAKLNNQTKVTLSGLWNSYRSSAQSFLDDYLNS